MSHICWYDLHYSHFLLPLGTRLISCSFSFLSCVLMCLCYPLGNFSAVWSNSQLNNSWMPWVPLFSSHVHCAERIGKFVMKAFIGNGNPSSFVRSSSAAKPTMEHNGEGEEDRQYIVDLPCVAGLSEWISRVCKHFNIKTSTSRLQHQSGIKVQTHPPFSPL